MDIIKRNLRSRQLLQLIEKMTCSNLFKNRQPANWYLHEGKYRALQRPVAKLQTRSMQILTVLDLIWGARVH